MIDLPSCPETKRSVDTAVEVSCYGTTIAIRDLDAAIAYTFSVESWPETLGSTGQAVHEADVGNFATDADGKIPSTVCFYVLLKLNRNDAASAFFLGYL